MKTVSILKGTEVRIFINLIYTLGNLKFKLKFILIRSKYSTSVLVLIDYNK